MNSPLRSPLPQSSHTTLRLHRMLPHWQLLARVEESLQQLSYVLETHQDYTRDESTKPSATASRGKNSNTTTERNSAVYTSCKAGLDPSSLLYSGVSCSPSHLNDDTDRSRRRVPCLSEEGTWCSATHTDVYDNESSKGCEQVRGMAHS